jgi:glycosyltransferase involved in cell wall biosynthesis
VKILFDTREEIRNITGIGRCVKNLAHELRHMDKPGLHCVCVPDRAISKPQRSPGRSLPVQLANFVRNLAWKQAYLPWRTLREKADLLVCMDPIGPLVSPVPVGLVVHDLIFLSGRAQSDAWTLYWRMMVPRCARRAQVLFAPSEATRKRIVADLSIDPTRIVIFREGVADPFRPLGLSADEARRLRLKLGLPEAFLLTVGAHDPRRNLKTLLRAYGRLKAGGRFSHKLVVVGAKTAFSREILEETRLRGLEQDVLYLDFVPDDLLPAYYNLADAYVYPSFEEGFGLTPLEAMACGCPVVTSRASSLPEVVGDAAVLVDPASEEELSRAIAEVLSSEGLRAELVRKGLERSRRFSWRAGAEEIVAACVERFGRCANA